MIGFFPDIYPDELLYSQLARYHVKSGYARYIFTAEDLYRDTRARPDIEFVNSYTADAQKWIIKDKTLAEVVHSNTMYSAYARFLPQERRQKAYEHLLIGESVFRNELAIPKTGPRYLRYCPCCALEDRQFYGETYWHRAHQIQRIQVCPKHKTYLEDSEILISGKNSPDLHAAESVLPNTEPRYCRNKRLIELTAYIVDVLGMPLNIKSNTSIGEYLNSKLNNKYRNESGLVRNITQLYRDYSSFYEGIEPVMTLAQMQKVFNGYLFDNYYICQLAFFEGLTVKELAEMPEKIEQPGMSILLHRLSDELGVEYSKVSRISDEVLKYSQMQSKVHKASGHKAQSWSALDKKTLPKVKELVDRIYNSSGRPQKVSLTGIQRMLGLPQKQIYNLPMCKEYIEQHAETQPEYWAREIEWAIKEVEASGIEMNWRHIRDLTNMRPNNLRSAIPFIKDERMQAVAELITEELK